MFRRFRFRVFQALCPVLLGAASLQPARGQQALGGELTYAALGNHQYRVRAVLAQDPAATAPLGSLPLVCKASGCGSAGPVVAATLLPTAAPVLPNGPFAPFCAAVVAAYPPGSPPPAAYPNLAANYALAQYEAVVTLPPAAEWVLSAEVSARPALANLALPGTLRLEATLNNRIVTAGGSPVTLQNNSPQFDPQIPFTQLVCWQQRSTLSWRATDADRLNFASAGGAGQPDSLVYSLDRPLNGCGSYETYAAYPTRCTPAIDPACPSRLLGCANLGSTYAATLAVAVPNDTVVSGPCSPGTLTTGQVRPRFVVNTLAGSFRLMPSRYLPTPAAAGDNQYVVVGQVTEYRRLNGRYYKVGSVRRDFRVVVVDCGANRVPNPVFGPFPCDSAVCSIGSRVSDTLLIYTRTCSYASVRLRFTDPDSGDLLTVYPPADLNTALLQNGAIGTFALTGNGTARPVGTFYFQPNAGLAGTAITATFRIEDNACPYKGIQYQTVQIVVAPGRQRARIQLTGATNLYTNPPALCAGAAPVGVPLVGTIMRPDSVRNPATGQVGVQTYRYQWTARPAATAGLPATTNTAALTVLPTATTRYLLTAMPTLGFASSCADTTSVLVRVVPPPGQPVVSQVGNALMSSYTSGNQWFLNGTAIAGATGQSYLPNPPPGPGYHYQVATSIGTPPYACTSPLSARAGALGSRAAAPGTSLALAPNPTPDGRIRLTLTGYRQPVTLAVLDALGRAVLSQTVAAPDPAGAVQTLDLGAAPAGVYVLRVLTAGGVDVRRLVRE